VAGSFGWRAFYALMAVLAGLMALALRYWLPARRPACPEPYGALMGSLLTLWLREPVLRRYALSAAACMAIFSAFWTAVTLRLVQTPFSLGDTGLALFALSGVTGTVIAPIAGRLGDGGHTVLGMRVAHWALVLGCVLAGVGAAGWFGFEVSAHRVSALGLLVAGAVVLDAGVVCDTTLGRRAINMLDPAVRSRLNGLFVGVFFVGGAVGAASAGVAWAAYGWTGVCIVCLGFTVLTFVGDFLQVPSREFRPTAA
jgi:predicted MFS family arabinose efflux permease